VRCFRIASTIALMALTTPSYGMECGASPSFSQSRETVTIKAVGDMVLGTTWPEDRIGPGVETRFFAGVADELAGSDIVFGNLEGALTDSDDTHKDPSRGTQFAFRMPPHFGGVLREAGFNVLNLANNHSADFGDSGLDDTQRNIRENGMFAVGLKDDIVYQQIRGISIAWIGFSYLHRHNSIHDLDLVSRLVRSASESANLVIVTFHGGAEGSDALRVYDAEEMYLGENRGNVVQFARTAVESGADLVLGHGPHVLRGVECYWQKLIVYSLGNFVGYGAFSTKRAAAISTILDVTLDQDGWLRRVEFHPIQFNGEHLPEIDPLKRSLYLLNDLSVLAPLEVEGKVLEGSLDDDTNYRSYLTWRREAGLEKQMAD
jgi:poly-gamma-glutamate capsule biosynthesis protein CapA/YwtB (metallophosphatase superfamily)